MKDENKTKAELIKELKALRKEKGKSTINNIHERKQAEEVLKESEGKLRNIFENSTTVFYSHTPEDLLTFISPQVEDVLGYTQEEAMIKWTKFVSDNPLNEIAFKYTLKAIETGKRQPPYEAEFVKKNGEKIWIEVREFPEIKDGQTIAIIGSFTDITERKQAEDKLLRNQYYLTKSQEIGIIGTWAQDTQKNTLIWTDENYKIFGLPPGTEMNYEIFLNCVHPDDRDYVNEKWSSGLNHEPYDIEHRIIVNDKVKWVREKADIESDTEGNLIRVIGVTQDITERKQAEEVLKESEGKLRNIFENSTNLFYSHTPEHVLTYLSPQVEDILGYTQEEAMIKWTKLTSDNPVNEIGFKYTVKAIETGKRQPPYELELVKKNGEKIWVEVREFPEIKDGQTIAIIGSLTDITERKRAEESVKKAKDELQMILDSVPAIIFYKDAEGRVIRANKTFADSLEIPVKDMIGKTTEELFPKEQAEGMRKDDQEVIVSGKPKRNIIESYSTPDGIRWAIIDKIPYRDKTGKVTGVIGLAKDITVQRKSEEKLQQTYQRLKKTMDAAIDTMSRIIEAKDPYTHDHQHRVCQLAVPLAREMKLPEDKIEGIRIASLIHDIGKIGLPTEILSKPGKLTDIEFSLIKEHSQVGYNILKAIDFSYPIANTVLQHHERLDGSGYPNNLKGDKILLEAKIIGIADVVEAMSSFRPYRPAKGIDKALEEISQNKDILYDPEVVDACSKLFKEKGFKFK